MCIDPSPHASTNLKKSELISGPLVIWYWNLLHVSICVRNREFCSNFTFSTTDKEFGWWQLPFWYDLQVPLGVPKLANFTEDIFLPSGQESCALAGDVPSFVALSSQDSKSMEGKCSDTKEHTLVTALLENVILVGSPPFSSKTTRMFPEGWNHDRGIWYLDQAKQIVKYKII